MGQFSELWMYCKETFEVVKRRLVLFVPRLLLGGFFLGLVALVIGTAVFGKVIGGGVLGLPMAAVITAILVLIGNLFVESGQINLFAKSALGHTVSMHDFREGISKYIGRVLAGGFLFILLFIAIGITTLIFVAIPLLNVIAVIGVVVLMFAANVFLSAWKAALAFKDLDVTQAFADSYRFAKEFFWPLALVVFVRGLFDGSNDNGSHKGGKGGGLSISGVNVNTDLPGINLPGMDMGTLLGVGSVIAFMPIAAAAILISTVITVYLDQLVFVIYARRENLV